MPICAGREPPSFCDDKEKRLVSQDRFMAIEIVLVGGGAPDSAGAVPGRRSAVMGRTPVRRPVLCPV